MCAYEKTLQYNLQLFSETKLSIKTGEAIIKSQEVFMRETLDMVRAKIMNLDSKKDILSQFDESTFEITRSMELLNTHQKLRTVARNRGILEEPTYFTVDENLVQVLGEFEEQKATGCLMPIKHQIISFFECSGILEIMLSTQNEANQNKVNYGIYENVVDGSIWKKVISYYKEKDENATVIPVHFYNDDFHIDSPVSPHSGKTKMTAYYYHFPTLPDYLTTNIDYIFLAMLHRSKDVDNEKVCSHGVDPALFALWNNLKHMETNGIQVNVDGQTIKVYIVFLQMYGDNLALNASLGFSRGLSGSFSCRICIIHKSDMNTKTVISETAF